MMDSERFTHKAQEALQKAAQAARAEGHPEVTPEHLAEALLTQEEGVVPALLERVGVAPGLAREDVTKELAKLSKVQGEGAEPRFSPALVKLIDLA
ncbi:MAG: Clp protease N-terminal domain-containing protein, partial [Thermoanaerobaculia bacterium]